jgi:hypothetical protein
MIADGSLIPQASAIALRWSKPVDDGCHMHAYPDCEL